MTNVVATILPDLESGICRDAMTESRREELARIDDRLPEYLGASCENSTPWRGSDCSEHSARRVALLSTKITDVPSDREQKVARENKANPELAALRQRATTLLKATDLQHGLILDLKASKAYGTSHFRLSEKQANAVISIVESAEKAKTGNADQPRLADVVSFLEENAAGNDFYSSLLTQYKQRGSLSDKQYAAVEKRLSNPGAPKSSNGQDLEIGIYRNPETLAVAKVQPSRQSGRKYAKSLDEESGEWTYESGLINRLQAEWKLSLEDAIAYGKATGRCINCGALLTNEESIEAGIGPICRGKF